MCMEWSTAIQKELPYSRESGNVHSLFAVTVKRSGSVVVLLVMTQKE